VGMTFEPNDHQYSSLVDAVAQNIDQLIVELREQHAEKIGQKTLDFADED